MTLTKRQQTKIKRMAVEIVFDTAVIVLGATIAFHVFLGAILQESYKLSPLTETEIATETIRK